MRPRRACLACRRAPRGASRRSDPVLRSGDLRRQEHSGPLRVVEHHAEVGPFRAIVLVGRWQDLGAELGRRSDARRVAATLVTNDAQWRRDGAASSRATSGTPSGSISTGPYVRRPPVRLRARTRRSLHNFGIIQHERRAYKPALRTACELEHVVRKRARGHRPRPRQTRYARRLRRPLTALAWLYAHTNKRIKLASLDVSS